MNSVRRSMENDSYEIEEPSDEERALSSSEDELDILLNGTSEQKKKLIREYLTGESESSSEDEFEKEMEAELNCTMESIQGGWGPHTAVAATSGGGGGAAGGGAAGGPSLPSGPTNPPMYDKVYFDSDSEEEDAAGSSSSHQRRQRQVLTNDELLYDPDMDDKDQAWVDARRRQYSRRKPGGASVRQQPQRAPGLPSSDAVLNCPACMTTLCLDCQRHEKYRTQYRAMFVMNCTVKKDEVLRYQNRPDRKPRSKRRRGGAKAEEAPPLPSGMEADEVYHPVMCAECSTEVAVLDQEDVYHFFHILASHC